MNPFEHLEPRSVFHYFGEICQIPHTSHHEKQLSDYCAQFAKDRNLFYKQEESGNIIIVSEATPGYEKRDTVILQGHLDMVDDKTASCTLNLEKDSIPVKVEGDFIATEGTTLGGDDGIAIAYALALLDANDIPHPRLEVIFTVCEEVGLLGASSIDLSICRGRRLINIDSEIEGILTVGCAGGRRAFCHIPVTRSVQKGMLCELTLSDLLGGHSGLEIHKGRANAISLLGRFFLHLKKYARFSLISMSGGSKENVIPKKGTALFLISPDEANNVKKAVADFSDSMKKEFGTTDPDISVSLHILSETEKNALTEASQNAVLTAVSLIPAGVQAMNADLPGTVETSINPGVMELLEEELLIRASIRSSVSSAKESLCEKIQHLTSYLGGWTEFQGDYPAWPYARESNLRDKCIEVFRHQYKKDPELQTIHAGLECGIFSSKLPDLDCISFGPDQLDVHTPMERLRISSVERVWEYLKALLAVL